MNLISLFALVALAPPPQDYPHRDWGRVAVLDMTIAEATACIARQLGRRADVMIIPVTDGNDIDIAPRAMWGPKSEPWQTYKIRGSDGVTTLHSFYRHPVKQNAVTKEVAKLQSACLKVRRIDPA